MPDDAFSKHPKKRRHAHHSAYHKPHPAESLAQDRPKYQAPAEVASLDEIESSEVTTAYQIPEEAPNILAVEAEDAQIEEIAAPIEAPAEPQTESVDEIVEAAVEPIHQATKEVEAVKVLKPEIGAPAEVDGEKVYIEQIFTSAQGEVVFQITKAIDNSVAFASESQLTLLDTEKEKAILAEHLKELWDANGGYIKGIHSFSHLGTRWTDPRDMTINRNVDFRASFEDQEAKRMLNRTEYLLGFTMVYVASAIEASRIRKGEHLFAANDARPSSKAAPSTPAQKTPAPSTVLAASFDDHAKAPMAISINALGR